MTAAPVADAAMAPRSLRVAVVVCAYTDERWEHLHTAVRALHAQTHQPADIVIVVDHNESLFERAHRELRGVRVISNDGERGLAAARNSGIAVVDSDVVAFLDDDAEPELRWLETLVAVYADPRVLGAGGGIAPRWERGGRPPWFPPEFDWVVGCTYRGMPTTVAPVRNMIGANMSVRRSVLELVGGFSERLGRVGADVAGTEETDLCIRGSQASPGCVWLHVPSAEVHHSVPPHRSSLRYFLRRCSGEGRSKAAMSGVVGTQDGLSSEWAYTVKTLPIGAVRHIRDAVVTGKPANAARAAVIVLGLLVTTWGFVRARLSRPSPTNQEARASWSRA